jgi:hypothetical protein
MKAKTKVKAGQGLGYAPPGGDHCKSAFYQLMYNPTDGNLQRQFCGCCAADPYCLY